MQFLDPRYDMAFKKLFGSEDHKPVTIAFLNAILEYTGDRKIMSISFMNNEQNPLSAEKKENILDIYCTDQAGRHYIVEMQNGWQKGFTKRIVWYGAKKYAEQLTATQPYDTLNPVIVVAITKKFKVFPESSMYKSIYTLANTKTNDRDLPEITFAFVELLKFNKKEDELVTDEDKWLFLLNEIGEYDHTPDSLKDGEFGQACQTLNRMTLSEREFDVYQKRMIKEQSDEIIMDLATNADEYIAQAREQGIQQGIQKEKEDIARAMLAKGMSVHDVAEFTQLSVAHVQNLKK